MIMPLQAAYKHKPPLFCAVACFFAHLLPSWHRLEESNISISFLVFLILLAGVSTHNLCEVTSLQKPSLMFWLLAARSVDPKVEEVSGSTSNSNSNSTCCHLQN